MFTYKNFDLDHIDFRDVLKYFDDTDMPIEPKIDYRLKTDSKNYVYEIPVFPFEQKDLNITNEDGTLTITGEREDTKGVYEKDTCKTKFELKFTLPKDAGEVSAKLRNNVLSITIERNTKKSNLVIID